MDKSKRMIIMSLLPAIVTLLFIILFLVPTIGNLNEIKGQLKDEKASFQETQNNLASIKSNKRLEKDVEKLIAKCFENKYIIFIKKEV